MKLSPALALIALLSAGCTLEQAQTGDEQFQTEHTINGMPAAEFYEQLLYVRVAPLDHRYISIWDSVQIGDSGLEIDLDVYMREGGTFTADYAELRRVSSSELWHENEESVSGTWHVEGATLVLDGLGRAEGLELNGGPAIELTFDRDIVTEGLAGTTAALVQVRSTWGPDGNDP